MLLLLLADPALCADNKTTVGLAGDELAQKVLAAAEAQDFRERPLEKVVSSVVKEAPPAELANGDGDIATTGPCSPDIDALCLNVPPGEGRLASCLTRHIKDEEKGNVEGRRVSGECKADIASYFQDRATNINKNLQLASACVKESQKFCADALKSNKPGAVLACLRKNKKKLGQSCSAQVLKAQIAAANDYKTDPSLEAACSKDAERICADVTPGEGRVQACLREHTQELSWDCQEELLRQEVEDSDDIRLNVKLFKACRADQQAFCKGVPYGANRVKDCLEGKRDDPDFSSECKDELEKMMARRAADFRLDASLRDACAEDIKAVCGYDSAMDSMEQHDARVIVCLQDFRQELRVAECRTAVHKVMERASTDIRFDEPLADSCFKDREHFCPGVVPGSARVIRCLQDNRSNLSMECRASLFDHEVRLAEDIDFQYPLKKACVSELKTLCTKVEKGQARLIRCLHRSVESPDMGAECKKEVRRNMNRMAQDYRLNFRLHKACNTDVQATCSDACPPNLGQACGGTMLRCLQDNMESLQSEECKKEVFYFVKMEVSDFRNDVMLAEACKADVESYCADVEPGDGRVLDCLRNNRANLNERCRKEELRLSQLQAKDVRLRPRLMKLCGEEMVVFCKDIKPGSGRMFTCLLENAQKSGFGSACTEEVIKREDLMKTDYRLDAGVSENCKTDIDVLCAEAKGAAHGKAEVLRCLVDKIIAQNVDVSAACQSEMSRAVRMAFWDFKLGAALTTACDEDVGAVCPAQSRAKNRGVYTIGVIGRCLTKQLAESKPLAPACRKLVTVAAPKDIRVDLQSSMNDDGTLKVGYMQQAVNKVTASGITLTGWVAVLSIIALVFVSITGAVWAYRRFSGMDKPYTRLVAREEVSENGQQ